MFAASRSFVSTWPGSRFVKFYRGQAPMEGPDAGTLPIVRGRAPAPGHGFVFKAKILEVLVTGTRAALMMMCGGSAPPRTRVKMASGC